MMTASARAASQVLRGVSVARPLFRFAAPLPVCGHAGCSGEGRGGRGGVAAEPGSGREVPGSFREP
eukprot:14794667-Alexandrium_andersonii.AAC.1